MVFLGGAVLANIVSVFSALSLSIAHDMQMADKENMWITRAEWAEQGARALEKLGPR